MSKYNPYVILDELCSRKAGETIAICRPEPYGTTIVEIKSKSFGIQGAELKFSWIDENESQQ